jgi:hypothetical protein
MSSDIASVWLEISWRILRAVLPSANRMAAGREAQVIKSLLSK